MCPPQTCFLPDLHLPFSAPTPCSNVLFIGNRWWAREIPGQVFKHPMGNPISAIIRKHIVTVAADVIETREAKSHDLTNPAGSRTRFRNNLLLVTDYEAGFLLAGHDGRGSRDASSERESWHSLPILLFYCQPPPPPPLPLPAHQPAHRGRPGHPQALDGGPHVVHALPARPSADIWQDLKSADQKERFTQPRPTCV